MLYIGDSLAMSVYGDPNTRTISLTTMLRHAEAVLRGSDGLIPIIFDMPIGSYATPKIALKSAKRIQEIGITHVKLEGGNEVLPQITALIAEGFTVSGHLGLLPQTAETMKLTGRNSAERQKIVKDALLLEKAGVKYIVLECIPASLGAEIADMLDIPVIGIGAGNRTDGQVLTYADIIGRTAKDFTPQYLRRFGQAFENETDSIHAFAESVRTGSYPTDQESYLLKT